MVCDDLIAEICSVTIPRNLVIQNKRMGFFYRVLQVFFFSVLLGYCIFVEPWRTYDTPVGVGLRAWCAAQSGDVSAGTDNDVASHCYEPGKYHSNDPSEGSESLHPNSCRKLNLHEACREEASKQLFLPTLVQTNESWQGKGSTCNLEAKTWCGHRSNSSTYDVASDGTCSCTSQLQYLAHSPEQQLLYILHGYSVETRSADLTRIIRGSVVSHTFTQGKQNNVVIAPGEIVTKIQDPSGRPCNVGGQSQWTQETASHGIGGKLKEWLACAGLDLETDPRKLVPGSPFPEHLRTMGLTLQVRLEYRNSKTAAFNSVECLLTVEPVVTWTRRVYAARLWGPGDVEQESIQTMYGVSVEIKVHGRFYSYNIRQAVSFLVEMLVILQLPLYMVQFICLYCLGIISEIYRNAKRSRLNIFHLFHGALAKMLLAEMGFRGLAGGAWKGGTEKLGLTKHDLFEHLMEIFSEEIKSGVLQMTELQRMVEVLFGQLDSNGEGTINCTEFVASCLSGENVSISTMARFFDDDAHVGHVRRYLDSSWHQRKNSMQGKNRKTMFRSSIPLDGEAPVTQNGDCLSISGWSNTCMEKSGESDTAMGPWEEQLATSEQEKHDSIGCERHLSSLQSLNIEDRVSELEKRLGSVDVLNLPGRVARLEDLDKEQQGERGDQGDKNEHHHMHQLDIKVSEINTALTDVRRHCNLRASQLVVLLRQEISALSKQVSEQLEESSADSRRRLEALDADLSVRYLSIKEKLRELATPAPKRSVQAMTSPRGWRQALTSPSLDVQVPPPIPAMQSMQFQRPAEQGGIHPCLSSALTPYITLASTLVTAGQARGGQVVEPCREATEEANLDAESLSF